MTDGEVGVVEEPQDRDTRCASDSEKGLRVQRCRRRQTRVRQKFGFRQALSQRWLCCRCKKSAQIDHRLFCNGESTGNASNIVKGGTSPYAYLWTPSSQTNVTATGLSAGTYTLTVTDACGAIATSSISITQPTAISIFSQSPTFNGTAAVRVSGGTSPYSYLWSPGGNTNDSIFGVTNGTYCCMVTDANGCKDSACVVVEHEGINSITGNSNQIVVYPNPNNGQFTIESSISGASVVEIYNILGEKVFTRNLSTTKGTNTIDISNQPNGAYLYRVISESGDLLGQGKITLQK